MKNEEPKSMLEFLTYNLPANCELDKNARNEDILEGISDFHRIMLRIQSSKVENEKTSIKIRKILDRAEKQILKVWPKTNSQLAGIALEVESPYNGPVYVENGGWVFKDDVDFSTTSFLRFNSKEKQNTLRREAHFILFLYVFGLVLKRKKDSLFPSYTDAVEQTVALANFLWKKHGNEYRGKKYSKASLSAELIRHGKRFIEKPTEASIDLKSIWVVTNIKDYANIESDEHLLIDTRERSKWMHGENIQGPKNRSTFFAKGLERYADYLNKLAFKESRKI